MIPQFITPNPLRFPVHVRSTEEIARGGVEAADAAVPVKLPAYASPSSITCARASLHTRSHRLRSYSQDARLATPGCCSRCHSGHSRCLNPGLHIPLLRVWWYSACPHMWHRAFQGPAAHSLLFIDSVVTAMISCHSACLGVTSCSFDYHLGLPPLHLELT